MTQTCRDAVHRGYRELIDSSHAGLLLSSYLQSDEDKDRAELLKLACEAPLKAKEVYTRAYEFFKRCLLPNTICELVEVDGRAVVGLGIESPLETGLALHHTYGIPYIPGSALKGLAAHYCHQVWGANEPKEEKKFKAGGTYYQVIFGATEDSGHIVFNDAWLVPDSLNGCLILDVMAVHHPDYYKKKDAAPSDYDDPTPITFLSVRGKFEISLRCDVGGEEGTKWARLAMNLLLEALEKWGVGAKTSSGYGRMRKVHSTQNLPFGGGQKGQNVGAGLQPGFRPAGESGWVPPCKPGDKVSAVMSTEKTKRGGWKAVYSSGGNQWLGHINNSEKVPADVKAGDKVELIVRSIKPKEIAFDWPT